MVTMALPIAFYNILWYVVNVLSNHESPDLLHIDWFAGVAGIHKAFESLGYGSVALDIKQDKRWMNFTSKEGILTSFCVMRRLRRRGGQHWGTVCSSWIFLNKATSRRFEQCPLGVPPRPAYVEDANKMVSLMCMFWRWALCKRCVTILEQPATSLMRHHPRVQDIRRQLGPRWKLVHTHMGAWGGPTEKPTLLHGDAPYMGALARTPSKDDYKRFEEEDHHTTVRTADGKVSGGEDLKHSQEYPRQYAEEVARLFDEHHKVPVEVDSDSDDSDIADDTEVDRWADAELASVCEWLQIPHDKFCF